MQIPSAHRLSTHGEQDRIRKEIEHDTKACWLFVLRLLAALTVALYVCVTLFSLWIIPIDSFIPVKIASVVGCVLLVAYTLSKVLVIFDSQLNHGVVFLQLSLYSSH